MADDYTLVSCDFHDELEAIATLHQVAHVIYDTEAGERTEVEDYIVDVFAKDKADFLKLQNGTVIRLDRIKSVNGKSTSYC